MNELKDFVCSGCKNNDPRMLEILEFAKVYEVECKVCSRVVYIVKEKK